VAAALDKLGVDVWTSASATTIAQYSSYVSATNNENNNIHRMSVPQIMKTN